MHEADSIQQLNDMNCMHYMNYLLQSNICIYHAGIPAKSGSTTEEEAS